MDTDFIITRLQEMHNIKTVTDKHVFAIGNFVIIQINRRYCVKAFADEINPFFFKGLIGHMKITAVLPIGFANPSNIELIIPKERIRDLFQK